jgi:hypothetical protein
MIRYKNEGGTNLQAYFAGLLALQTLQNTSDYKTTAVLRVRKYNRIVTRIFHFKKSKNF